MTEAEVIIQVTLEAAKTEVKAKPWGRDKSLKEAPGTEAQQKSWGPEQVDPY